MRRRLVAAIAGVAILALLLYAVPRAFMIADMVRDQEQRSLDRGAMVLAQTIDRRLADGEPVDAAALRALVTEGEAVHAVLPDGTEVTTGVLDPGTSTFAARRSLLGGGAVTLRLRSEVVEERVTEALVPVAAIGTAIIVLSVGLAIVLARRLSRPFTGLASYAATLGPDAQPAPRAGIAEADQLADALDEGRVRLRELLAREREFSANASHQLRTPLAALRLRLEDLTLWPDVPPAIRDELVASLAEIDRLSGTITDLLELARLGGLGAWIEFDLCDAVEAAVDRWTPMFDAEGRTLVLSPGPDRPHVATSQQAVGQVLDVVLENALDHGTGVVDVQVELAAHRAAVRVSDEGTVDRSISGQVFERSVRSSRSGGSGIGLSLAQTIAASAGARLGLVSTDPTVFELAMPIAVRHEASAGAAAQPS